MMFSSKMLDYLTLFASLSTDFLPDFWKTQIRGPNPAQNLKN